VVSVIFVQIVVTLVLVGVLARSVERVTAKRSRNLH
jgi:hypothetical protein